MSKLSDRLNEAKGADSVDPGIERARKRGHKINRATVYKYLDGQGAKRPSDATLAALAAVFDLDVKELRQLADLPSGEREPYVPPAYANQLNREQRRALNELIRTMVDTTADARERAQWLGIHSELVSLFKDSDGDRARALRIARKKRSVLGGDPEGAVLNAMEVLAGRVRLPEWLESPWPVLSAAPDTSNDAIAAHEEEAPIAGEQEESDTP